MTKSNKSTPKLTAAPKKKKRRDWLVLAMLPLLACAGWWAGTTVYHKLTFHPTGQIAFECWPTRGPDICIVNADGSERKQLTSGGGYSPSWSPSGTRIVFARTINNPLALGYGSALFIMNLDGSGIVQLTDGDLSAAGNPSWSPDGEMIAFTYFDGNKRGIAKIKEDGSDQIYLTDSSEMEPVWSPDGTRIAYIAPFPFASKPGIYAMNADGSDQELLVDMTSDSLSWSPDGMRIAFTCSGVCVINSDGTDLTRLTNEKARSISWSPDGQYFAYYKSNPFCFLCNVTGQLWIMKADGSQPTQLTDGSIDLLPTWRPQP